MDILIRFVNIIAWLGAVIFGSRVTFVFLVAVAYNFPGNQLRQREEKFGVRREFRYRRDLLLAFICAAWIFAAGAY
jgi:hypothetical protein